MRLIGIGKYNTMEIPIGEDISKEEYDKKLNRLNNEYKNIIKTTDDYELVETIKNILSEEEINNKLENLKHRYDNGYPFIQN